MTQPRKRVTFASPDPSPATAKSASNSAALPAPRAVVARATEGTFRSLRHRNFQLYFGGQLISVAGTSMMFNSARVIGPAIGGLLLASVGAAWCFLFNGLSYLAVIAGLWAMTLPPNTIHRAVAAPLKEMAGGLRYVWHQVDLFALLL